MAALLRREERRLAEHMSTSLPDAPHVGAVEESLAAGFRAFLSAVALHPDSYRVVFSSEHGPERVVQRSLERARLAQNQRIAELVRDGMEARGIDQAEGKAQVVASVVMGASEGAVRLLLSQPDDWTPDELAELVARLMARGLGGLGLT